MKITIEIDAELDGEWLHEYEDEFIHEFTQSMPGVILCGDDDEGGGCAVLFNSTTLSIAP